MAPSSSSSSSSSSLSPRSALAQKLVKYGLPEGDGVVQIEDTFATSFDSRTRNPRWVLERLTKDTVNGWNEVVVVVVVVTNVRHVS